MHVERFPFDYDALKKGDSWSVEEQERITGLRSGSARFSFAVMKLGSRIETELRERGRPVVVATVKGILRILTDEEAVDYTARQFRRGLHAAGEAQREAIEIDVANLADEEKKRLERNIVRQGFILASVRKGVRAFKRDEQKRLESDGDKPQE